jgi:lactoylglutathione lyase
MIMMLSAVPLYVADQERSKQFYADRLGFEVRTDAAFGPGQRWLEVAPKGAQTAFAIVRAADFDHARVGGPGPATLTCADVRALHADLTAHGVEVSEPVVEPWSTYVTLVDPDGWQFVVGEAK